MDKITQALKKILPAEHISEVAKAVEDMMAEQVASLEKEFHNKLDEAYEQLAEERKADEAVAEAGYQQAYQIVSSLMNRLDEQREEFETALEEGFEEAYNELQKEKSRNQNLEVEIYTEADAKLQEMKNLMVDKLDQFLSLQEAEIYEAATQNLLKDPRVLEQRIAIERVAEVVSEYMGGEAIIGASSSKIEEAQQQIDVLKGQLRILESKNIRLASQNTKLGEQVREANTVVAEAVKVERTNRANKRGIASGRGQRVASDQIISEYAAPANTKTDNRQTVSEGHDPLNDLLVLSGLVQS